MGDGTARGGRRTCNAESRRNRIPYPLPILGECRNDYILSSKHDVIALLVAFCIAILNRYVDRSLTAKQRTVTASDASSNLVGPPNFCRRSKRAGNFARPFKKFPPGTVAERRMHFIVDEDDDGSSPFGPATIQDAAAIRRKRERK